MAGKPIVNITGESFDTWRQKTNEISENVGDVDTLVTQPTIDNCVDAINEAFSQISAETKSLIARSWFIN